MPPVIIGAAIGFASVAVSAGGIAAAFTALTFSGTLLAGISAWATVIGTAVSFAHKPKISSSTSGGGSTIDFKGDPSAGVPLVIGRTGTAGSIVHVTSNPTQKNTHLAYLSVLSAGPIRGIESWWVDGEQQGGSGLPPVTGITSQRYDPAHDGMIMTYQKGLQPTDDYLETGLGEAATPEWTHAHKLSGLAAVWWRLRFDQKVYPQGVPKPVWWVVLGPTVYDPRLDSTWPGGSGPCRWNDESTWTGEDARVNNPFCQGLSWLAGRRQNGKLVMGVGLPRSAVDVAAFIQGANVCDLNGWLACGGVVLSTDDKWEVLKGLLQAGGGMPTRLSGMVSAIVQSPRVSIATITREDITGEVTISGTKPRSQRVNTVTPRYRAEDQQWQVVPGQVVQIPAYVQEDRGERAREVEFPLLQDKDVAAQLAAYAICDSREFEPVTLPVKPYLGGLKPGDCVTVMEPELGLVNQKLVVWGRDFEPKTGAVTLTLRSETDAKHPFCLGQTDKVPGTAQLQGWDGQIAAPLRTSFSVVAVTLDGDKTKVPAIRISGTRDTPYAGALLVQYRIANGAWIDSPALPFTDGDSVNGYITGIVGSANITVRLAYLSILGTQSDWTEMSPVDTATFVLGALDDALADRVLTPGEKAMIVPIIASLVNARASLLARASEYALSEVTSPTVLYYRQSQDALDAYLATLTSPVGWNDFSGNTDVPQPVTFRARLEAALTSERNLQTALDQAALGIINDLLDDVETIASDGVLTPAEKNIIIPMVRASIAARASLRAQADAAGLVVGVSQARYNYESFGIQVLDATLDALNRTGPKNWDDVSGNTTISDPGRFRDTFHYVNWTTTELQSAIDAAMRSDVLKLAGDGLLTPADKLVLVPTIKDLIAHRPEMRAKADAVGLFEYNNLQRMYYEQANTRLDSSLTTLSSPVPWDDRTGNTVVPSPGSFVGAVNDCSTYEGALENQWFQLYNNSIIDLKKRMDASLGAVSDGVLTRTEKNQFIPTISYLVGARAKLRAEAATVGGVATLADFNAAASRLDNMLAGLTSPVAWNNTTDVTNIPNPTELRGALAAAMQLTEDLQTAIAERQRNRLGAWAYYVGQDPVYVGGAIRYFGYNGQAFDWRAGPINEPSGDAAQKNIWPLTSDTSNIYVQGFIEVRTNQTLYLPGGSVGGLASDTEYDVFWFGNVGSYIAVGSNNSPAYKAEPSNYLFIGRQRTAASPGVYNPPAPPPDNGYVGGGSASGNTYMNYKMAMEYDAANN